MSKVKNKKLTISEFARLAGVNKRTLHFYDEKEIFSPLKVEENGYRTYSFRQLYPFYMLRQFREMGLSLEEISLYMKSRTPKKYEELLKNQEKWLDDEIKSFRRQKKQVQNQLLLLKRAENITLDIVEERELPETSFVHSRNVREIYLSGNHQEAERILAKHLEALLKGGWYVGYGFGTMIAEEDYQISANEKITSYFISETDIKAKKIPPQYLFLRPKGMYAVTHFAGDYNDTKNAYELLREYSKKSGKKFTGYAYEESLIEDLSSSDKKNHITRIAIRVM